MDDSEIFAPGRRDFNARRNFGERLGGEKRKGQVRDGGAEFGAGGAVPGVDFVEGFEQRAFCRCDAQQIEAGVGDGAGSVGEADKGEGNARGPDFGVIGPGGFERGERENDVADGAGADQEASHFSLC